MKNEEIRLNVIGGETVVSGKNALRQLVVEARLTEAGLQELLDKAKNSFPSLIRKLQDEAKAEVASQIEKRELTLERLAVEIRAGGYPSFVAGGVITILSGKSYRDLPPNQYVATARLNGNGVDFDTAGSEQSGAVDNVVTYLARKGISVGIHSSGNQCE